jgi:phenylacetate-CoA ligase
MKNIWNEKYETMEISKLREFQSEKLREVVSLVYGKVPFYKKRMDELSVKPSDIKGVDDISKLPFVTKDDLRDTYPYGLVAANMDDVVEIHASSGTTGIPIINTYTRNDLEIWAEGMARTLTAGGLTKSDILQNAYGYGLFTGGLGAHYGGNKIGLTVLPISSGNTKRQISMMKDLKTTALSCTPSYSLYLAESGIEMGIDFEKLPLRAGFFGAEAWSENMRKDIEKKLHIKAYDIYGLTEIIGPGVAFERE